MYELRELEERKKGKFTVTIVADENDGDDVTTVETYSKEEFDEYVEKELILLLQNCWGHHKLEENVCDFEFGNISIPRTDCSDSGFCHTLESVNVTYIDDKSVLWKVDLAVDREGVE